MHRHVHIHLPERGIVTASSSLFEDSRTRPPRASNFLHPATTVKIRTNRNFTVSMLTQTSFRAFRSVRRVLHDHEPLCVRLQMLRHPDHEINLEIYVPVSVDHCQTEVTGIILKLVSKLSTPARELPVQHPPAILHTCIPGNFPYPVRPDLLLAGGF